ncbi:MAG TPA: hypothetical protein VER03_05265 [Bryobacteraceae bacterium]|nr:hypothetical protein [Bryobacteraceae bacterium]
MYGIPKSFQTAAIGLALTAVLSAQSANTGATSSTTSSQDTYHQQSQGNKMGSSATDATKAGAPASNPGFGQPVPSDSALSGGQPHSNSTYQNDRNGDQGLELGWLGLLGLAGLFGIGRGQRVESTVHHDMQNSGSNRS